MTESQDALAKVFVACWQDEAMKERFKADPKAVLAEHGLQVPDQIMVDVNEDTDFHINLTIPTAPAGDGELSDGELEAVAGGKGGGNRETAGQCQLAKVFGTELGEH